MLAGVLLHVIEASLPIDHAGNFVARYRSVQNMRDSSFFIADLRYLGPSKLAEIERLSARSRIERCAIEINFVMVRARVHNTSPEFRQVAVVIVKALRH